MFVKKKGGRFCSRIFEVFGFEIQKKEKNFDIIVIVNQCVIIRFFSGLFSTFQNDSMTSYFENSILARKSLGVTLREKLIKRIDKQRQKEAEISKPNETKESEPIAETEQLNLEQQQIIDDDNELQSGLDQVTIESIQEQHDYFGSDEIETPERVLSPIEMEQSVAKMLNVDDLSEDHIETTETDVKAMENNDGDDYEEEEEEETDYNVNMSEMTGNFFHSLEETKCEVF